MRIKIKSKEDFMDILNSLLGNASSVSIDEVQAVLADAIASNEGE